TCRPPPPSIFPYTTLFRSTKYFKNFIPSLKLDEEGFLALGREDVTNRKQGFSMAVLAIRLADQYNAVSALHGDVSRQMWHNIWPDRKSTRLNSSHVAMSYA